jgi:hypothetical protein
MKAYKTMLTTKTADILNEAALILYREHPAYAIGSDRIYNVEFFLRTFASDKPESALAVAADIRANKSAASETCGLSPDRCGYIASVIERYLSSVRV